MLNSYHAGYEWTDELVRGVEEVFSIQPEEIELWVENMDTRRLPAAEAWPLTQQLLARKYTGRRIDAIVSADDDALEFLIEHRAALFPKAPVVFCGVNSQERIGRAPREWFTGLREVSGLGRMLDEILRLHPKARRMVIVNDNSATGLAIRDELAGLAAGRRGLRVDAIDGSALTFAEVRDRLAAIPVDSVVITSAFTHDRSGKYIPEALPALVQSSSAPVYSPVVSRLGQGLVGGSANNGYEHGRRCALIALRILRGESPAAIPVVDHGDVQMVFDNEQLQRWRIDESRLPARSTVVNRPGRTLESSLKIIWGGGVFITLLLLIILSLALNIFRRKKAEERLRQSQESLALAQQIAHIGSWERDLTTGTLTWSDEIYRIYGVDPSSFQPTFDSMIGMIHPEDRERVLAIIRKADAEGLDRNMEYRIVRPDGAVRTVRVIARHIQKPRNRVIVAGTVQDLTELREVEEQLRQVQKMESVGQLAGGIAHDFNNLLTVILGHAHLSLRQCEPGSPLRKPLEEITRAGERAAELTRQLLAFGRKQVLRPCVLNLNDVIQPLETMLRPMLGERIAMKLHLAPSLAPVEADRTQLEQVLINLAGNARDAMPEGGVIEILTGEIEVDGAYALPEGPIAPGRYVQLTFRDSGHGMDEATRKRIFEPFFTTKAKGKGTGLGLSTVYGIVRQSGGYISVSSAPGKGTEFRILLPAAAQLAGTT